MIRVSRRVAICALIATALPAPAAARLVYFNRAGVEPAMFTADVLECESLASGVNAPAVSGPYTPNLYAVAVTAFLSGFLNARTRRDMVDNVLRTCMVDKGYRRIEAVDEDEDMLRRLPDGERLARLAAFAADPDSKGKQLPR